jgi:uncharacterized protein (TIRG00374 family)
MMKNLVRLAIALSLSGFFLWLAFRHVDWSLMWQRVHEANRLYVLGFVISLAINQFCRVLRWDILIRPFTRISTAALFRISNVGLMLILLLPLRLGEFARPYLLKKESGAPLSSGMGSIVVERVIDGLLVVLLFFATTLGLHGRYHVPPALKAAAAVALGVFAGGLVVSIAALCARDSVFKLFEMLLSPISPRLTRRVLGMLDAFIHGLRVLPDLRAIFAFSLWTVAYWVANGLGYYCVMRAFGWDLPVVAGFALVSVIVIGIMIPAGPGHLGTFQGAILAGLAIFGVGPTDAAAYGMVVYPITVAAMVAFGLPYLLSRGGQVSEIMRVSAQQAP